MGFCIKPLIFYKLVTRILLFLKTHEPKFFQSHYKSVGQTQPVSCPVSHLSYIRLTAMNGHALASFLFIEHPINMETKGPTL